MKIRHLSFFAVVVLLLSTSLTSFAAEKNIIFFITDDESPTLGCYGDPVAVSPAADALAADGCRFTHAYPDGPAPYYSVTALGRRGSELEQWAAIKDAAWQAIIELGGTITHHHAVGRDQRPGSTPQND